MSNLQFIVRNNVRHIAASVYCYGVLGVFAAGFGLTRLVVPYQSTSFAAAVGGLVASPLIIGAVWSRLTGLKILGVEVALSKATVLPTLVRDQKLAAEVEFLVPTSEVTHSPSEAAPAKAPALSSGGGPRGMAEYIDAAIQSRAKIVTVNLQNDDYWYSTRLFLLAALLEDFSGVDEIVFVAGGDECRFVAMASPGAVRRALAWQLPAMNVRYAEQRAKFSERAASVRGIFEGWLAADFGASTNGGHLTEPMAAWILSAEDVAKRICDSGLARSVVSWDRNPDSPLLGYTLVACDTPYVALVCNGRLDKIIDRASLASSIVRDVFREHVAP